MKIIVIPGYSTKNKEWATQVKSKLSDVQITEWPHWSDINHRFKTRDEAEKLLPLIKGNNVIAKSIGTLVLVIALAKEREMQKIILCGVPVNDLSDNDKSEYKILSDIDPTKVIVFQNSNDEHGSFEEVRRFLSQANPNIKIVEKPGKTHDYPYFDEFKEFLEK